MENALLQLLGNSAIATLLVVMTYLYLDERKQSAKNKELHTTDLKGFNEAYVKIITQEAEGRAEVKALAMNQLALVKRILKKLNIDV